VSRADGLLLDRARRWLAEDPDQDTQAELAELIERRAMPELADRFAHGLEFGTAGLRGALGAGPNRMNRATVLRAAAAVCAHVRAAGGETLAIGYDARHKSREFALDTASVAGGAGLRALMLPRALPTPVLSFATRELGCAAGVMVTASHNPATDNGYKVYLGDGSQIVPPVDEQIAAAMAAVTGLADIPRGGGCELLGEDIVERYLTAVSTVVPAGNPRDLRIAYTPLHGVGGELVTAALQRCGFAAPAVVAEQAAPDPDFPTVAFPNPEEPGALDLALALAGRSGADVVLANDPDGDRLAVAVPVPAGWQMLRGDEVGVLLADTLLRSGAVGTYATTIVSSSLLSRMTRSAGAPYAETLTGFKWLSKVAGLRYGYEEALGYCVAPSVVPDKDGISALLLVAAIAAEARSQGRTLLDRLDDIAATYGVHATDQLSVRLPSRTEIEAAVSRLVAEPPRALGGFAVESVEDLSAGASGLPATVGVRLQLAEGGRVVVRPSGTEAKLKGYLEVVVAVDAGDVGDARRTAQARLAAVRGDLARAVGR
jgi:phosphomannomutase